MILETAIAGGVVAGGALARAVFAPRSRLCGPLTWRGDAGPPPRVALTFDDGPHPEATPATLDTLADLGVRAAFFVIGRHARAHPRIVMRIHAEGHLLGNHSDTHAHMGTMRGLAWWRAELARADASVEDAAGVRPALFRPPMGFKSPPVMRAAAAEGHTVVTWTRRGLDGRPTSAARIERRLRATRAGDIVALHDGIEPRGRRDPQATIDALAPLVRAWRERGMVVSRLDELIGVRSYRVR